MSQENSHQTLTTNGQVCPTRKLKTKSPPWSKANELSTYTCKAQSLYNTQGKWVSGCELRQPQITSSNR